jgi:hypothetical protein
MTAPAPATPTGATSTSGPATSASAGPAPTGRFGYATVGAPPPYRDPGERPEDGAGARRRWPKVLALVLAAVLLLAAALLGGRAWGARGQTEVWQLTRDLGAGEALRPADVRAVRVSAEAAAGAVPGTSRLGGRVTVTPLPAGTVLRPGQLAPGGVVPGPGEALVGVAATAGLAPDGLRPGDTVSVVRLPPSSTDQAVQQRPRAERSVTVLIGSATVQRVAGGGAQGSLVTLVVPQGSAAEVAGLAAQGRVALVAAGG